MNQFTLFAEPRGTHRSNVDTRSEAAAGIAKRAVTLRARALELIRAHSALTADEIAHRMGESVLAIRPRVSELRAAGMIVDSGLRRRNLTGNRMTVWKAVAP